MTISTSNAHQRTPGSSPRELVLAIGLLLTSVAAIEAGYRNLRIEPSQRDTVRLWTTQRVAIDDADNPVVFLGSSRILHAIHLETLEERFPGHHFFQLGVVGSSPLVMIERLAADESFDGIVIAEYYPTFLYGSAKASRGLIHPWLSWFDSRSWIDDFESRLRVLLKEHFVLGNVETRPTFVLYNALVKGRPLERTHLHIHADRWQEADFTRYTVTRWTDTGEHRIGTEELRARLAATRRHVERIRARGGA